MILSSRYLLASRVSESVPFIFESTARVIRAEQGSTYSRLVTAAESDHNED